MGLISISGSVLLGGVLISTISNIIERRVGVVYAGRMTYRNIKNHYVLIGCNELSINMIRELYDECPSARILLMSGMESATVRHRIQSALPVEVERPPMPVDGTRLESQRCKGGIPTVTPSILAY